MMAKRMCQTHEVKSKDSKMVLKGGLEALKKAGGFMQPACRSGAHKSAMDYNKKVDKRKTRELLKEY